MWPSFKRRLTPDRELAWLISEASWGSSQTRLISSDRRLLLPRTIPDIRRHRRQHCASPVSAPLYPSSDRSSSIRIHNASSRVPATVPVIASPVLLFFSVPPIQLQRRRSPIVFSPSNIPARIISTKRTLPLSDTSDGRSEPLLLTQVDHFCRIDCRP